MPELYIQAVLTILGAGFTSYMGVRVALAEIRGELKRHDQQFDENQRTHVDIDKRLVRLESVYFRGGRREGRNKELEG